MSEGWEKTIDSAPAPCLLNDDLPAHVKESLSELQAYLSDSVAPIVVAGAVETLMDCPPELVAAEVYAWAAEQYRRMDSSIPISDYLFHSVRKIHMMGEFSLVDTDRLEPFLVGLKEAMLSYCPEEDRGLLAQNLGNLSRGQGATTQTVSILHRQAGAERPQASGTPLHRPSAGDGSRAAAQTAAPPPMQRRVALLLDRLEQQIKRLPRESSAGGQNVREDLVARTLAAAATNLDSPQDLRQLQEALRLRGLEARMEQVFKILSGSMPAWTPEPQAEAGTGPLKAPLSPSAAGAMRRLVALQADPADTARRFIEMVGAAIDQFNAGASSRAAATLQAASEVLVEKHVDVSLVKAFLQRAHERIDVGRLRKMAESSEERAALRSLLLFFPEFGPGRLIEALQSEEKRERRRLLLALLEAHGQEIRPQLLASLADSVGSNGDSDAFFQRNLLLLLHRLPRPQGALPEEELDLAIALSSPYRPPSLVKEALAYLGQCKNQKAERALADRVSEMERILLSGRTMPYDSRVMLSVLDRGVYALARFGTFSAARTVVEHGLRRQAQLGNTVGRLATLGHQNLGGDSGLVSRLIEAVEAELPRRILGFSLSRGTEALLPLFESLAGTPTPAVRECLSGICKRFSQQPFASQAARVLAGFDTPAGGGPAAVQTISGDLEVFGLPNLLQSLAHAFATGTLLLNGPDGRLLATFTWQGGGLVSVRYGRLENDAAFYQLLQRPSAGSFQFNGRQPSEVRQPRAGRDIVSLLLEGMRRYDEFTQAAALVPDDATFYALNANRVPPADEEDSEFVQKLWGAATSGITAIECELDFPYDSFRVKRLLAQWVEEGALVVV